MKDSLVWITINSRQPTGKHRCGASAVAGPLSGAIGARYMDLRKGRSATAGFIIIHAAQDKSLVDLNLLFLLFLSIFLKITFMLLTRP